MENILINQSVAILRDGNNIERSIHDLSKTKNESKLIKAAKERGLDPKAEMWKLPAMEVGAYAEKDAELTLELWQKFKQQIIEDDLQDIFNLETDLFPCLVDMKFLGVRVDVSKAHELKQQLQLQEDMLLQRIKKESTIEPQIWAARSIAKVFDQLGLEYERTAKANEQNVSGRRASQYNAKPERSRAMDRGS